MTQSAAKTPQHVSFVVLNTQFGNVGDALINRELLRLLQAHGRICVDASVAPPWFVEMLALPPDTARADGSLGMLLAMLRSRLRGQQVRFFFLPGGMVGELAPAQFVRKTILLVLFGLLRAAGVRFCHLGVSYERLGWRHAAYLRWKRRLMDAFFVRDMRSARLLQSLGVPIDGVLPDLAFNLDGCRVGSRSELRSVGFSFRTDQHPGQFERVHAAVVQWLARLPAGVSCRLAVQVERDRPGMQQLAERLRGAGLRVELFEETRDIGALQRRYGELDLVVSNRLHVLLLAASAGSHVVACVDERNEKILGLFESSGREDLLLDMAGLSGDAIERALAAAPLDGRALRAALREGVAGIFCGAPPGNVGGTR